MNHVIVGVALFFFFYTQTLESQIIIIIYAFMLASKYGYFEIINKKYIF